MTDSPADDVTFPAGMSQQEAIDRLIEHLGDPYKAYHVFAGETKQDLARVAARHVAMTAIDECEGVGKHLSDALARVAGD